MKTLKVFSLLFISIFIGALFTGCSSDDENSSSNMEDLVGFWIRYADNDQEMEEFGFFSNGTCNYTYSYDPDYGSYGSEYEFAKGTYTVNGNKVSMNLNFGDETETWTFTIKSLISKDKLVITDEDGDTYTFDYLQE